MKKRKMKTFCTLLVHKALKHNFIFTCNTPKIYLVSIFTPSFINRILINKGKYLYMNENMIYQ